VAHPRRFRVNRPTHQVQRLSFFIPCMNDCGRRIEITPALAERILISRNPVVVDPEYFITCCECAFGVTSEQLLHEN
jgi:hypothetical protein